VLCPGTDFASLDLRFTTLVEYGAHLRHEVGRRADDQPVE
jgi:hypothetical protein